MKPDARHPELAQHPELTTLALLAGGDLAWSKAFTARWHVRCCSQCKRQVENFRRYRIELGVVAATDCRQPLDVPPVENDPAWTALEAEMRANIRLGLTAGSLASRPSQSEEEGEKEEGAADENVLSPVPFSPWRWAVVCGAMVFVLTAGWWLRSPGGSQLPVASAPALEIPTVGLGRHGGAQSAGQEAAIQLLVPVANVSRTETDFDGSTRSRVIDGETGQVTLQQVYVQ